MAAIGIISGAYRLRELLFKDYEVVARETGYGQAEAYLSQDVVFLARHGNPARLHIAPHLINHTANMALIKELGVKEIFAFNSVGSLKREFKPAMFALPHDFIMLERSPSALIYGDSRDHFVPELAAGLRGEILAAVHASGIDDVIEKGVYWQTPGPRLETRAEIKLMANFADLVGMTMAGEAVAACEQGLAYASLCSIDNYAHGIGDEPLTASAISEMAAKQTQRLTEIIKALLAGRGIVIAP